VTRQHTDTVLKLKVQYHSDDYGVILQFDPDISQNTIGVEDEEETEIFVGSMDAIKQLYIDKQVIKSRRKDSLNTCSKLSIDNLSIVEPRWELWRRVNQQRIAVPTDATDTGYSIRFGSESPQLYIKTTS